MARVVADWGGAQDHETAICMAVGALLAFRTDSNGLQEVIDKLIELKAAYPEMFRSVPFPDLRND